MSGPRDRIVTLREMVESMVSYRDDEVFRRYQKSHVGAEGWAEPDECLVVTMGQARAELGLPLRPGGRRG